jgi:hypothetical protein
MLYSSQAELFRGLWRSRASSSGHFERPSAAERARAAMLSALAEPSGFEIVKSGGAMLSTSQAVQFRAHRRSRASSSGHFERPSGADRARAAIPSAPAEPSGLARRFRAPQRSRPGSSGHLERPSGADWARSRERRQVRCFRCQAKPAAKACKPSCGNFELVRLCTA